MDKKKGTPAYSERGRSVSLQEGDQSSSSSSHGGASGMNLANLKAEREDRRQTHSAMERRYRQELNSQINELKGVVPACSSGHVKGMPLNKVAVLKRTTEYIAFMQQQDHVQRFAQRLHVFNTTPIATTLPAQLSQLKEQQRLIEEQQQVIESLKKEINTFKSQRPETAEEEPMLDEAETQTPEIQHQELTHQLSYDFLEQPQQYRGGATHPNDFGDLNATLFHSMDSLDDLGILSPFPYGNDNFDATLTPDSQMDSDFQWDAKKRRRSRTF